MSVLNSKLRYNISHGPPQRQVGMTRQSVSGIYLFRGETPVAFESTLERDFLIRLEADTSVLKVISQPVTIQYQSQGRQCRYTPDYLVHYRQDNVLRQFLPSQLIEVKPEQQLARNLKKWKPKFRAATRYCLEQGYVFRLMHEGRIRDQVWENMRFLVRYRRIAVEESLKQWIYDTAKAYGCLSFQQLVDACCFSRMGRFGKAHGIAVVWHLLATGQLACDLVDEPLSHSTMLWVADHDQ